MIDFQKFSAMVGNRSKSVVHNIPNINVKNQLLGELKTLHSRDVFNPSNTLTELVDSTGKVLGKELFSLEEGNPNSVGFSIEVIPECRNKGFKLGEILRLSSIMMLIENKIKNFEIFSKDTAIYFHSKYFFEPAITQFKERDFALKSILTNCVKNNGFDEFKQEASNLIEKSLNNKDAAYQRSLCVETNNLLKRYIKKVLETKEAYKNHSFYYGMRMLLTDENIVKNSTFFNELFKKHGIDYKI